MKTGESLPQRTKLRSSKCLNNLIAQDHRHIKWRMNVMLGFKRFRNAAVTISGIELMHRISQRPVRSTSVHLKDTMDRVYQGPIRLPDFAGRDRQCSMCQDAHN